MHFVTREGLFLIKGKAWVQEMVSDWAGPRVLAGALQDLGRISSLRVPGWGINQASDEGL